MYSETKSFLLHHSFERFFMIYIFIYTFLIINIFNSTSSKASSCGNVKNSSIIKAIFFKRWIKHFPIKFTKDFWLENFVLFKTPFVSLLFFLVYLRRGHTQLRIFLIKWNGELFFNSYLKLINFYMFPNTMKTVEKFF